ncbi:hypothetical protein BZK31_27960 [Pseudomonas floridensis]|uniref:YcaO domain-containing protein n=1 Tax=Pseudomonas floridensis TaxID=1958950 RepID=A0A1X0MTH6_9PSED|nr:YcaO-like family protein [Pseudomonas floridensis]ORC50772.1 hypothetical protein BZK31_27960 [Pseudomonas floridensis]
MFEREYVPAVARDKILQATSSLSLSASLAYENSSKTVAICVLSDNEGRRVSEGAGKGYHCDIGALAESIEHYALSYDWSRHLVESAVKSVRLQPLLKMDGFVANLPSDCSVINCVTLTDMQSGAPVLLPAVLQMPHIPLTEKACAQAELSFLNKYSSNSGVAFGCSRPEALLHGLNEVVERHVLSKIFMSLCGQHERLMLAFVSTEILDDIFCKGSDFRSAVETMKILIVETIYGVYFSMAIPKRPDGRYPICPIGSGCSVDPRVAVKRAASELLQATQLFDESEKATDFRAYALMRKVPALQPLLQLDVLRNIDLPCKRLTPSVRMSVTDQMEHMIKKISSTGLRMLSRTVLAFENGCAVTQVYVPGLERFNLIRAGLPVVPQHLLHANESLQ